MGFGTGPLDSFMINFVCRLNKRVLYLRLITKHRSGQVESTKRNENLKVAGR